ncbi:MAG: serine hydrolase domain-containing protein [Cytophagales bacterium]|nr:serine hydrolase domain-containing protein [Cytophagales bacterium]
MVLWLLLTLSPFVALPQNPSTDSSTQKRLRSGDLDEQINQMMDDVGVPGMSLAIIENNQVVFAKGYGNRKGNKKVNKRTMFNGGSLSKSYLVFVTHQLADEGKLDLDRPMYEYLPNDRLNHDERYKLITPRMVMSHSSGLENWAKSYYHRDTLDILSDPGKEYIYSGEGYNYLASVIKKILGQSYEEYITERVVKTLKLKTTRLKFKNIYQKFSLRHPTPIYKISTKNHTFGHSVLGQEREVYFNTYTNPAAGNHFSAEDYAKLIIATFDGKRLSEKQLMNILEPEIWVRNSVYYGPGFEVAIHNGDTLVAHGGDDQGHKNYFFYSVKKKRGFVFLTNSDRGLLMTSRLNELTIGMDLTPFLKSFYFSGQYPSATTRLLKAYDNSDAETMFQQLQELSEEGKADINTLNTLAFLLGGRNKEVTKSIVEMAIELYPESSTAYALNGRLHMRNKNYGLAYENLSKAKELNFAIWRIKEDLEKCENTLNN